tara:strand:+ start:76 stop:483 length:408 start_codon:yes stop_codon:yes gene_type:complete
MELTETGRRKSKNGKGSHSLNLADQVFSRMYPTPTTSDQYSASSPEYLEKKGRNPMTNQLRDAVRFIEEKKMFPTPSASDNRDRGNMSNPSLQRRLKIGKQLMLSQVVHPTSGKLNPNWVEWLMGYETGHTDLKD